MSDSIHTPTEPPRTLNPFDNPTECHDYNTDYSDIVPQIVLPEYSLPVIPTDEETKKIRKSYNIAGGGLLLHLLVTQVLVTIVYLIVSLLLTFFDGRGGELPGNYTALQEQYINDSSIMMAIQLIILTIANPLVALLGCKMAHIKVGTLFQPLKISAGSMLRYILVGLFLQCVAGMLALLAEQLLAGIGVEPYEADFSTGTDPLKIAATVLCTCVVAPITEELLYRGFFMKAMSRVSQRFAIFTSAVFFGLVHENLSQFILAFLLGILLGYVTTKYNSLIPAMVIHFVVNSYSMLITLLYEFNETAGNVFSTVTMLLILLCGAALFIFTCVIERLPDTTPHQSIRGGRIAVTSWTLILTAVLHITFAIIYCL